MACALWVKILNKQFTDKVQSTVIVNVRHGHHLRGKPPGVAKTIEERLASMNINYILLLYFSILYTHLLFVG